MRSSRAGLGSVCERPWLLVYLGARVGARVGRALELAVAAVIGTDRAIVAPSLECLRRTEDAAKSPAPRILGARIRSLGACDTPAQGGQPGAGHAAGKMEGNLRHAARRCRRDEAVGE